MITPSTYQRSITGIKEKSTIDSKTLMESIAGVQKEIHLKLVLSHQHRFIRKNHRSYHEIQASKLDIDIARLKVIKQELLLQLSKNHLNSLLNG